MEIHKLLQRQLNRTQISAGKLPDSITKWEEFISRINKTYLEADQERYLLDRSIDISSREMMMLNEKLERAQHIAGLCYWQYDGNTDHVVWSKEFYNICHLDSFNAANTYYDFLKLVHPDEQVKLHNLVDRALKKRINYECEIRIKNYDGQYKWYRTIAHCHEDKNQLSGILIDINKDKKSEEKIKELNQKLLMTARQAGMAEIATSILHNIGNILNSSNVSINMLQDSFTQSYYQKLFKVIDMLKENNSNLNNYLLHDAKGKLIPEYLIALVEVIKKEYKKNLEEVNNIDEDLQHIKDIVSMQQSVSGVSGPSEKIFIPELIETALQMSSNPHKDKAIEMCKQYMESPFIISDRSKLLQILVNLIQNAKDAVLKNTANKEKKIEFIVEKTKHKKIHICVIDNGVGILPEHLNRIFSFGFTTKKNGHGFGLHSCALSAQDMGGSLKAESQGIGKGAAFILTLPVKNTHKERGVFNE